MVSALKITGVRIEKTSFRNDVRSLPADVRLALGTRIELLLANPKAGSLRFHALRGYHPTVHTIDITSGKGPRYKATFVLDGSVAVFLRVGTHKQIDHAPR